MSTYAQYGAPSNQVFSYQAAPGVGVAPGPFGGMQFVYVQDPLTELGSCTAILIKQQPEFLEKMSGCETENRYMVFGNSPQGFKFLFKCKEKSSWFSRMYCPSNIREFDMQITHVATEAELMGFSKTFAHAYKPCTCNCLCLCRPEINVTLTEGNQFLGKIVHACSVCDPVFHVYDSSNALKYIVTASCCQCGLLFGKTICGKLSEVEFSILEPSNENPVGSVVRKVADNAELVTDADSYELIFPVNATQIDKMLLTALGLMIDYQYFEVDANEDKKKKKKFRIKL